MNWVSSQDLPSTGPRTGIRAVVAKLRRLVRRDPFGGCCDGPLPSMRESRAVVGSEVILGAYSPLLIAARDS
jgi:hypothetical protein